MAQGLVKKQGVPKPVTAPKSGVSKRGSRQINPKNTKLIKAAKINKKFTSGLTAQTEKMLAERAGHLELLAGGKKRSGGAGADAGGKAKHGKKNAAKKT